MTEKEKFKAHFSWIVDVIFFVWEYKFVFTVMGFLWSFCAGIIINFVLIPLATPIVRPIIDARWIVKVAPYDSMALNNQQRLTNLEEEVFPEAGE